MGLKGVLPLVVFFTAFAVAAADDSYSQCPHYPSSLPPLPDTLPERIAAGIAAVNKLLANVSSNEGLNFVATIVYDQQTLFTKGYGTADPFDPTSGPPNGSHLVRIASITKTFTSQLLYKMRDAGVVRLDDAVAKWFPEWTVLSPYATKNMTTLRQLASHTSGMPRDLHYPCGFTPTCTENDVLEMMRSMHLVVRPYTRFHYSNIGFGLLGRTLEKAANRDSALRRGQNSAARTYEVLLGEEILRPLGMSSTFVVDNATLKRMAVGVNVDGTRASVQESGWDAPAGGLLASADDMALYMKHLFRTTAGTVAAGAGPQIMDGTTVSESLASQTMLRDGSSAVGLPWEMKYSSGVWMKSKQGELAGFRSSVTVIEPLKLGIFVSAMKSEVDEKSVWTIPAMDLLVPALIDTLGTLQPKYELPPHAQQFVGKYYFDSSVWVNSSTGVLEGMIFGTLLNFTAVMDYSTEPPEAIPNALAVHMVGNTDGCRWLDDGADQELIYFEGVIAGDFSHPATQFKFMGSAADRLPRDQDNHGDQGVTAV